MRFRRAAFAALGLSAILGACDARRAVQARVVGDLENYFREPGAEGLTDIQQIAPNVYTFRWTWYRNIAVVTDEGIFVADPFNAEAAALEKAALEKVAPGAPVHTLFYTHYHLDHAGGGAALAPRQVYAHEKCPRYWEAAGAKDILAPTQLIDGDQTLEIGGVEIRLLYLGLSHSDTLYAVHLPAQRVLFTADLGLVRTIPPVGIPDRYGPGYEAAMRRLAQLDFDAFVPSHFGYGKRQDFLDSLGYFETLRTLSHEVQQRSGGLPANREQLQDNFLTMYDGLKERYGDWHGFNEMIFLNITRGTVGELLGF